MRLGKQRYESKYLAIKYFYENNLCRMILQENLSINNILKELDYLQKNANSIKNNIKNMQICDGTAKIMDLILKLQKN